MSTDSVFEREGELMTYLRNTVTDPSARGSAATETFDGGGTTFTLIAHTGVKNITSITVTGVTQNQGYDYVVSYGEGSSSTVITFRSATEAGTLNVSVSYRYGPSHIYIGFQREDATLPRIAVIFNGSTSEFMSIGEQAGGTGRWILKTVRYTCEVRSNFAKQMKDMLNDLSNKIDQLRQATPQLYMAVIVMPPLMESFDFDGDLRIYRGQVMFAIQWQIKFKD